MLAPRHEARKRRASPGRGSCCVELDGALNPSRTPGCLPRRRSDAASETITGKQNHQIGPSNASGTGNGRKWYTTESGRSAAQSGRYASCHWASTLVLARMITKARSRASPNAHAVTSSRFEIIVRPNVSS